MAQSNYALANKSAPASRAKINDVFQSIATNNSGTAPPSTTFPHQWWYDTTTNILKQRNAADSAWIDIGSFDQGAGTFTPAGQVAGLTQIQAEDPDSTVFGTVSGQRLAQAVLANAPALPSPGDIGSFIFARGPSTTAFGDVVAGSSLTYAGALTSAQANSGIDGAGGAGSIRSFSFNAGASGSPSGSWKCLGRIAATSSMTPTVSGGSGQSNSATAATLWQRVA